MKYLLLALLLMAPTMAFNNPCSDPGTRGCSSHHGGGSGHSDRYQWVLDQEPYYCEGHCVCKQYHYQIVIPPNTYPGNATRIDYPEMTKKKCVLGPEVNVSISQYVPLTIFPSPKKYCEENYGINPIATLNYGHCKLVTHVQYIEGFPIPEEEYMCNGNENSWIQKRGIKIGTGQSEYVRCWKVNERITHCEELR